MGRLANCTASGVLVLGLAVAGCGSSESSTQPSSTHAASQTSSDPSSSTAATPTTPNAAGSQTASGPTSTSGAHKESSRQNTVKLSSPAFREGSAIPARYTCDGANVSPPLRWSKIPTGTVELVLFVVALKGTISSGHEVIAWAVAGLRPTLKGISAGTLPNGAVVGRNSFGNTGYTVCPAKGSSTEHYLVVMYTLQHSLSAKPGFDANALSKLAAQEAVDEGLTGFSYKRG